MSGAQQPEWTVLAHLLRPQGRKGELLAELLTDFPDHFLQRPKVSLAAPGFIGREPDARPAEVSGFWLPVGRNQGRVVLAFAGIASISEAESLAGLDVLVPTSQRVALEPGAEYIDALIGCCVFDGSARLGTVNSVGFSTGEGGRRLNGVAPLLTVVTTTGHEILIPFVEAFLAKVDTEAGRIDLRLPPGLVELNQPGSRE